MLTQLSECFKEENKSKKRNQILFACNINKNQAGTLDPRRDLKIDLLDPNNVLIKEAEDKLKEKITEEQYILRIDFTPTVSGVYKLIIQYKYKHIPGSPFHFEVQNNLSQIKAETKVDLSEQTLYVPSVEGTNSTRSVTHRNVAQTLEERLSRPMNEMPSSSQNAKISLGRGRLMSLFENSRKANAAANGGCTSQREPCLQLKRKSPRCSLSSNANNIDNIEMETEIDTEMTDLSRKLKKMVYVDESENQYHNYSQSSLSSITSINVITETQVTIPNSINNIYSQNILSDHLRKHGINNSLIRPIMDINIIPPVKAVFERRFDNCSFPIGVRFEKTRNWLIVCDSSSNSIKIFSNLDGSLIHVIEENKNEYKGKITLKRPSAVLINNDDNNSEIYVKDDKEIFVFNLNRNFEFTRKFGFQILKKPYGLAYDSNKNLVLVDADLRNPLVYIFDKYAGTVISSKPYQPIIQRYVQSETLTAQFANSSITGKKPILSSKIAPFDRTKVRFIYCNQDSLYASDLGRSIVYKTNLNGEIQSAFGHFGKGRGEFFEPSGIHVENDGNAILIGDSKNNRLQVNKHFFLLNLELFK